MATHAASEQRTASFERAKHLIGDYGLAVVFAGYFVFIALASDRFLSFENLVNVVRQSSIIGLVAIGMTFVMITAGIDLSVGALVGLAAVVSAAIARDPRNGLLIPVATGLAVGLVACTSESGRIRAKLGHVHLNLTHRPYRGRTN